MRKKMHMLIAVVLAVSLLAGCAEDDYSVKANETISPDSKWISSGIEGAVDETLSVRLQDDFFTAVNKDWLLGCELNEEENEQVINFATEATDVVNERIINILYDKPDEDAHDENLVGFPDEELAHEKELVSLFGTKNYDKDYRNSLGTKPLEEALDRIEGINSIDELTAYVSDFEKSNYAFVAFADIGVDSTLYDSTHYSLIIMPETTLSLMDNSCYLVASSDMYLNKEAISAEVKYIYDRIGKAEKEANSLIKECFKFESLLVDNMQDSTMRGSIKYERDAQKMPLSEIEKLCGNYPIMEILKGMGYDSAEEAVVYEPEYLEFLGDMYDEDNLEGMKAYLEVMTISYMIACLDIDSLQFSLDTMGADYDLSTQKDFDELLQMTCVSYISGPLNNVYVSKYNSQAEKETIENLVTDIRDYYSDMLMAEDWFSESARLAAVDKLEALKVNVLYPETFETYADLDFDEDDTIPEMVQKCRYYKMINQADKIGQTVDRDEWNFERISTTTVNAYYDPSVNGIYVLAGIIAGDSNFSIDESREERLAKIGFVIGHEITHAFDDTGSSFDKDGNFRVWWELNDLTAFSLRGAKLITYYATLAPYPGGSSAMMAASVLGEATADLGSMKCMLGLASNEANFDYDLFFRSFAKFWREYTTYEYAEAVSGDVHPMNFLRVNVPVSQFDEFIETYDIKPGDGMYVAPSDRISVW